MPDRHLGSALLAAHNEMMVARWLEHDEFGDRFRGTIRVNPDDIAGALREIERWRAHPRMVQIGVPLQSRELYGKPQFLPLWEAAADAGLPVAVHIESGNGIVFPPTPSGNPRTYPQYVSFMALNYLYHLMNMITEGVFERLPRPEVRVGRRRRGHADAVHLADGHLRPAASGADAVGARNPERLPARSRVLRPGQPRRSRRREFAAEWLGLTGKEDMVMFGSSYPHWQCGDVNTLPARCRPNSARSSSGGTRPSSTA